LLEFQHIACCIISVAEGASVAVVRTCEAVQGIVSVVNGQGENA